MGSCLLSTRGSGIGCSHAAPHSLYESDPMSIAPAVCATLSCGSQSCSCLVGWRWRHSKRRCAECRRAPGGAARRGDARGVEADGYCAGGNGERHGLNCRLHTAAVKPSTTARTCWPITRRTTVGRGAAAPAAATSAPPLPPLLVLGLLAASVLAAARPLKRWGSCGASMLPLGVPAVSASGVACCRRTGSCGFVSVDVLTAAEATCMPASEWACTAGSRTPANIADRPIAVNSTLQALPGAREAAAGEPCRCCSESGAPSSRSGWLAALRSAAAHRQWHPYAYQQSPAAPAATPDLLALAAAAAAPRCGQRCPCGYRSPLVQTHSSEAAVEGICR